MRVQRDLTTSSSSSSSGVFAFVVLKDDVASSHSDVIKQLKDSVSDNIAKYAVPDHIQVRWTASRGQPGVKSLRLSQTLRQFVQRLPKTRSGKIVRRVLRKVVEQDPEGLGDLSTMDDPSVIQEIVQGHRELRR